MTPASTGRTSGVPQSVGVPSQALIEALALTRTRIATAAATVGRSPHDIHLLAVSKQQPAEAIHALALAGQRHFGESYPQEALPKIARLRELQSAANDATAGTADAQPYGRPLPPIWHFIGQLQTNKTRLVAEHFDWVHTLDRLKIAQRLGDQRPGQLPPLNVCIQVKLAEESGKGGVAPDEIAALAAAVSALPRLRLRGLMCIPPPAEAFAAQKAYFDTLAQQLHSLQRDGFDVDTLSMGMSADLEAAVAAGATWVRIGTAIFGARAR